MLDAFEDAMNRHVGDTPQPLLYDVNLHNKVVAARRIHPNEVIFVFVGNFFLLLSILIFFAIR